MQLPARCGAELLIALALAADSGCGALRGFHSANSLPLQGRVGSAQGPTPSRRRCRCPEPQREFPGPVQRCAYR